MRSLFKVFCTLIIVTIISVACANESQPNIEYDTSDENVVKEDSNGDDDGTEDDLIQEEDREIIDSIDIVNDESYTALVNKFNNLSDNYTPDDLVTVAVPTILENPEVNQLREEASQALTDMFAAAEQADLFLFARSGFRSYDTQVHLFNGYAEKHGEEAANTYSAKPGFSEHQTGLVMDVTSESVQFQLTEQFGDVPEGEWIRDHAHEFGFIIRYPQGKEDITGYIYEPWHLRYLGKDVAAAVYESNVTYEEFLVEKGVIDDVQFTKE